MTVEEAKAIVLAKYPDADCLMDIGGTASFAVTDMRMLKQLSPWRPSEEFAWLSAAERIRAEKEQA